MNKIVNVRATVPVRTINPPIYGNVSKVEMSTGDILKCLCFRATVDEVLPDGSTVRLTMKNYAVDYASSVKATVDPDKEDDNNEQPKVEVSDDPSSENKNQMVEMSDPNTEDKTDETPTVDEEDDATTSEDEEEEVDETETEDDGNEETEEVEPTPATADTNKSHKNKKNKRK